MMINDIVLICVMVGLTCQLTLKQQHQGSTKLKSPCQSGWKAYDNCISATTNGCGSSSWQAKLSLLAGPYAHQFGGCCDQHDICWGTCALTNFEQAFHKCNLQFKSCMYAKCKSVTKGSFWLLKDVGRKTCQASASVLYEGVDHLGKSYYQGSIDKHCACYNPKTKEKKGNDKC